MRPRAGTGVGARALAASHVYACISALLLLVLGPGLGLGLGRLEYFRTDATLHVDTTAAEASLKLSQAFGSSTPIIELENATVTSSKANPQGSMAWVINGSTYYINYHS